jgi:phage-related protein
MAIGFDVGGTLGVVVPDKGFSRSNEPRVFIAEFGDGYEQRLANGINNIKQSFDVNFANRPKDEIDDIVAFFESKKGATAFNYVFSDSNAGSNEETVKVVCEKWNQTWAYDDYYNLSATFRRIYEA